MNRRGIRFIVFVVFILICVLLGRVLEFDVEYYRKFFQGFSPVVSGALFVLLYVGTTTFIWFGPKDILRFSAAVLFGGTLSTVFVSVAEIFNAAILFWLSRNLGRDFVQKTWKLKSSHLDRVPKDNSIWGVLALRLNLLFPLRLIDLGYGLARISLFKYILISICATPFRVFFQQYFLARVGEKVFTDPAYTAQYLLGDRFILGFSLFYVAAVIILTIVAVWLGVFSRKTFRN